MGPPGRKSVRFVRGLGYLSNTFWQIENTTEPSPWVSVFRHPFFNARISVGFETASSSYPSIRNRSTMLCRLVRWCRIFGIKAPNTNNKGKIIASGQKLKLKFKNQIFSDSGRTINNELPRLNKIEHTVVKAT